MIDLRSDTVTTPSNAMRDAARDADVGDDVYGEDPTVNELEAAVADRLGFEAAVFVPTGTMGNQIAIRTHTEPGQEILVDREAHVFNWEVGGLALHSGLQTRPFEETVRRDGRERGVPTPEAIESGYVEESVHRAGTGLVSLENTHNGRGGLAIAPERIDAAAEAAHDLGVPVHLDGARLFNAAVAHDVPAERFTRQVDSAMVCLSKGLGAPIGSMLAGSAEFVEAARRNRKLLGGGMRQAGIVAAPGLLALDSVDRLADDHRNADRLAVGLADLPGLDVVAPETNIVLVDVSDAAQDAAAFKQACADAGVACTTMDETTARFCTHRNVDKADVDEALSLVADVVQD
ncbi:l-threonine aldolase [Salinarchaeum sp. Harcht-Bsk1]|uniref:threonine aldolase family protein n=1 Tax=Salinarchaeum sp. Harcht-Bsk1 TaxID=1333523 RepID=UPI0003423763|nr:low specificity L-threonine aldolase [Salinarchaeum sp. Harcht-Bsk1]AGN01580.1 l-threonine aldolase [Salinarchaeum sp. Harcht-Bsk1]